MTLHVDTITKELDVAAMLTLRYDPRKGLVNALSADHLIKKTELDTNVLSKLISSGIAKRTAHCKQVAVALSSGIDSQLMLSLTKESIPSGCKLYAICMSFGSDNGETKGALKIADHVGIDGFIDLPVPNILTTIGQNVGIIGEPRWNTYFSHVVKAAKKHGMDLLITGDGGDELFGGYVFRYKQFTGEGNRYARVIQYLKGHVRDYVPDQHMLFGERIPFSWQYIYDILVHNFDDGLDPLDQVFLADYNGKLACDFIPSNNALFAHYDMDGFAPLLQPEVVKYAFSLKPSDKYNSKTNTGKLPLRMLLKDRTLDALITEEKIGFGTDIVSLWYNHGKKLAVKTLGTDSLIIKNGLISKAWLAKHLYRSDLDARYVNKLLMLIALELWLNQRS